MPVPGLQLGHLRTPRNTQRLHSVENSPLDIADSPRGSVMSLDFSNIDDEAEGESVQVRESEGRLQGYSGRAAALCLLGM